MAADKLAMSEGSHAPLPPAVTGLRGVCPRCGEGRLFKGFLGLQPGCDRCGLDYSFIDAGDGPAVFVIFIVATVVVCLAIAVEFTLAPPLWVHVLIWWPTIVLMCLGLLRPIKGLMVAMQYALKAAEGRVVGVAAGDGQGNPGVEQAGAPASSLPAAQPCAPNRVPHLSDSRPDSHPDPHSANRPEPSSDRSVDQDVPSQARRQGHDDPSA